MKKMTRRQFMALALSALATSTAVVWLDRLLDGDSSMTIDPTVGELDEVVLDTLMEMVRVYVGDSGSIAHYRPYFTWRAENLSEYRSTYQGFVVALDEAAQELLGSVLVAAREMARTDQEQRVLVVGRPAEHLTTHANRLTIAAEQAQGLARRDHGPEVVGRQLEGRQVAAQRLDVVLLLEVGAAQEEVRVLVVRLAGDQVQQVYDGVVDPFVRDQLGALLGRLPAVLGFRIPILAVAAHGADL